MLVLGIGFFNLGADIAMTPMGVQVGSGLSQQKSLGLLLSVCFTLGVLITVAEPDLQVLANQVSSVINGKLLIFTYRAGKFDIPAGSKEKCLMKISEKIG